MKLTANLITDVPTMELLEKLQQENTMLHEENKKLNETVEWMHEMIWDFVHAQRATQSAPPLHPL